MVMSNMTTGEERKKHGVILKRFVRKLKHLQLIPTSTKPNDQIIDSPRANDHELIVPNDVKEGQVAILSKNPEEEPQRFVVDLHWLTHPSFLKLLKQAEDEYGFIQKGVLEVPCRAEELQNVLQRMEY